MKLNLIQNPDKPQGLCLNANTTPKQYQNMTFDREIEAFIKIVKALKKKKCGCICGAGMSVFWGFFRLGKKLLKPYADKLGWT
jgi:hypothetical protein